LQLSNLAGALEFAFRLSKTVGAALSSDGMAEAEACLREALVLCEETDDARMQQLVLRSMANMSGADEPGWSVEPAEAQQLHSRLNQLYAQTGRSPNTSCTICLESLKPGCGAEPAVSVRVLSCGHQYHNGCISEWWERRLDRVCPLCKK